MPMPGSRGGRRASSNCIEQRAEGGTNHNNHQFQVGWSSKNVHRAFSSVRVPFGVLHMTGNRALAEPGMLNALRARRSGGIPRPCNVFPRPPTCPDNNANYEDTLTNDFPRRIIFLLINNIKNMSTPYVAGLWSFGSRTSSVDLEMWRKQAANDIHCTHFEVRAASRDMHKYLVCFSYNLPPIGHLEQDALTFIHTTAAYLRNTFGEHLLTAELSWGMRESFRFYVESVDEPLATSANLIQLILFDMHPSRYFSLCSKI